MTEILLRVFLPFSNIVECPSKNVGCPKQFIKMFREMIFQYFTIFMHFTTIFYLFALSIFFYYITVSFFFSLNHLMQQNIWVSNNIYPNVYDEGVGWEWIGHDVLAQSSWHHDMWNWYYFHCSFVRDVVRDVCDGIVLPMHCW